MGWRDAGMLMSQTLAYFLRSPVFWSDHEVKASSPAWCSEACLNWPRMGQGSLIITVVIIIAHSLFVVQFFIHWPIVYLLSTYYVSSIYIGFEVIEVNK